MIKNMTETISKQAEELITLYLYEIGMIISKTSFQGIIDGACSGSTIDRDVEKPRSKDLREEDRAVLAVLSPPCLLLIRQLVFEVDIDAKQSPTNS